MFVFMSDNRNKSSALAQERFRGFSVCVGGGFECHEKTHPANLMASTHAGNRTWWRTWMLSTAAARHFTWRFHTISKHRSPNVRSAKKIKPVNNTSNITAHYINYSQWGIYFRETVTWCMLSQRTHCLIIYMCLAVPQDVLFIRFKLTGCVRHKIVNYHVLLDIFSIFLKPHLRKVYICDVWSHTVLDRVIRHKTSLRGAMTSFYLQSQVMMKTWLGTWIHSDLYPDVPYTNLYVPDPMSADRHSQIGLGAFSS